MGNLGTPHTNELPVQQPDLPPAASSAQALVMSKLSLPKSRRSSKQIATSSEDQWIFVLLNTGKSASFCPWTMQPKQWFLQQVRLRAVQLNPTRVFIPDAHVRAHSTLSTTIRKSSMHELPFRSNLPKSPPRQPLSPSYLHAFRVQRKIFLQLVGLEAIRKKINLRPSPARSKDATERRVEADFRSPEVTSSTFKC